MASTSTCVEGKYSSFLLQASFLRFPELLEELQYDGTVKFKIRQLMILIVLVNSKIIKEKIYSFRYNGKQWNNKK